MAINANTTAVELAALVSQTLEAAGIKATLSGGGAVSRQSWDQAVMVASHTDVDFDELIAYAKDEGADPNDIDKLHKQAVASWRE